MSTLTDFAKRCALDGAAPRGVPDDHYPFLRDRPALRFDAIFLRPRLDDGTQDAMVVLRWRGNDVCELRVKHGADNEVYVYGIEGTMDVRITE